MLNYQRVLGKHPEVKSQCQYQLLDVELGAKWMAKRYEDVTIEQYDLRNVWSRSVWRSVFVLRALRMHGASKTGMQHDATRFCMHPCLYQMVFFGSAKLIKTRTHRLSFMSFCVRSMYTRTPLTVRRATMTGIICGPAHISATVAGHPSGSNLNLTHNRKISVWRLCCGKKSGVSSQHYIATKIEGLILKLPSGKLT